jgi:hypothetical protein
MNFFRKYLKNMKKVDYLNFKCEEFANTIVNGFPAIKITVTHNVIIKEGGEEKRAIAKSFLLAQKEEIGFMNFVTGVPIQI